MTCPECEYENDRQTLADNENCCEACGEEVEVDGDSSNDDDEDLLHNIVVGIIVTAEPIPKKTKLTKLSVDIGDSEIQVVTNAKHMDEGRRVVVATVGAVVGDVTVKKSNVRQTIIIYQVVMFIHHVFI